MSGKTLKSGDVEVVNKKFHASKQPIALDLVDISQILMSYRFKHNNKDPRFFIGHKVDDTIRPLCIVLPQVSGYINYFGNGGKICSLRLKIIVC